MKITKRQLRRIIREEHSHLLREEEEEFKPRYKGDTPAKQGSMPRPQKPGEELHVNMDFQRNDPGDGDGGLGPMDSLAQAMFAAYNNISAALDDAEEELSPEMVLEVEEALEILEAVSEKVSP